MAQRLTQRFVDTAPPPPRPRDIRDEKVTGLILRCEPSGLKTYFVEYGRGKRRKLERANVIKLDQARELAAGELYRQAAGMPTKMDRGEEHGDITLAAFIEHHYAPWARVHLKRPDVSLSVLAMAPFQRRKLGDLTLYEVERWKVELAATKAPATTNRYLTALRGTLKKAREWGFLTDDPLAGIKKLAEPKERIRYLSDDERARLFKALRDRDAQIKKRRASGVAWRQARGYTGPGEIPAGAYVDHLEPLTRIALATGARKQELLTLTWGDVERGAIHIRPENSKTGRGRWVPLNGTALAVLERWREHVDDRPTRYVFAGNDGGRLGHFRSSWAAVVKAAGLVDFTFHDCRHDCASQMAMRGVPLHSIGQVLGHSSSETTRRYAHLSPRHLADAVSVLDALI